jgi:hypothetical protein
MTMDPWPVPTRTEPRAADPPEHADAARPVLPLAVARRIARDRLTEWRREHGN